jgi:mono/diheme cytochrome c family protein
MQGTRMRRGRASRRATLAACVVTLLIAGCGGGDEQADKTVASTGKPVPTAAQRAKQARLARAGRSIFLEHCHSCHTILERPHTAKVIEMEAPNFDDVELEDPGYIRWRVMLGGFDMQSFDSELSDREIAAVVAFVGETAGRNVDNAAADASPAEQLQTGRAVFRAQCQSCHTLAHRPPTGSPTFPGTNFDDVKPGVDYVVRQVSDGLEGIMPSFRKRLTSAQIQAVARYVTSVAAEDGRPFREPRY